MLLDDIRSESKLQVTLTNKIIRTKINPSIVRFARLVFTVQYDNTRNEFIFEQYNLDFKCYLVFQHKARNLFPNCYVSRKSWRYLETNIEWLFYG